MNKKSTITLIVGIVAIAAVSLGTAFAVKKINADKALPPNETAVSESAPDIMPDEPGISDIYEVSQSPTEKNADPTAATVGARAATPTTKSSVQPSVGSKEPATAATRKAAETTVTAKEQTEKATTKANAAPPVNELGDIPDEAKAGQNAEFRITGKDIASLVDPTTGKVLFDYSWSEAGQYFYTDEDPWQRNLGYSKLYDMGAKLIVIYYDTFRVIYEHGGYQWMLQAWKGQYGYLFIGSEMGLYYKTDDGMMYNCATKDMEIMMQMTLYRVGYGKLFTRPYASHWWTTAFVSGSLNNFNDRSELIMVGKLSFKSEAEARLFALGLSSLRDSENHTFKPVTTLNVNNPETYCRNGATVDFVWRYFDEDKEPAVVTEATTKATTEPTTSDAETTTE